MSAKSTSNLRDSESPKSIMSNDQKANDAPTGDSFSEDEPKSSPPSLKTLNRREALKLGLGGLAGSTIYSQSAAAQQVYEINRCQTLHGSSNPTGPSIKYRLTQDITGSSSGACFRIIGHNVILDGNGYHVSSGGQSGVGVLVTDQAGGATIENIGLHHFNDYRGAIFVENGATGETIIRNCNISRQQGGPGIYIRADQSTIQKNYIHDNDGNGLAYNAQTSPNHTIENNGFWGNGNNGLSYGAAVQGGGLTV